MLQERGPRGGKLKTAEHKQHISEALSGRRRPDIALNQTTSWKNIRPLLLRGATPAEVADITDLTQNQAAKLASFPRTVLRIDNYYSSKNRRERKRRAGIRANRTRKNIRPSAHETNSTLFVKALIKSGFINEDTIIWEKVCVLFGAEGRKLTDDFSYGLVLEAFWKARERATNGNNKPLDYYVELGKLVNSEWFTSGTLNADRRAISEALGPINGDNFRNRGNFNRGSR